jgi:Dyp-type peroxidase family
MTQNTENPSEADLRDIQGNLVGFNKDLQRLIFVGFPDQASSQRFLLAMADDVNHAAEVREFNAGFVARSKAGEDPLSVETSWVNFGLSFPGLTVVGAAGLAAFPQEFQAGMRSRAAANGDVDASDPANWTGPFAPAASAVHALIVIAADQQDLLDDRTSKVRALIAAAGVTELAPAQDGHTRPEPFTGHEHFGFKDGISQPYVRGMTSSNKGGEPVAAGEFLIGYEDQDGDISGSAIPQPPQPTTPGQPGYPAPVQPQPQPLAPWTRNGSFIVYRRLRQDVGGFHGFTGTTAPTVGLSQDQLEAKLIGRWASGAPLEHVPGEANGVDPSTIDPSTADPRVLDDDHINKFAYQEHDADGHLTPRAAHIRKVYPRDETPPGAEEADRHRMLRRGIVYGSEFTSTEPPYPGAGPVPDTQDRGLLFLCYQASIARSFEFVQQSWANTVDFPQAGDGLDPIISQDNPAAPFPLPANPHLTTLRWVTTTGGDYYFTPAISALRFLGGITS